MQEWLKRRPVLFASLGALIAAAADRLWLFDDVRAATVGGVITFAVAYLSWPPGGFGWRIEAEDQRWREEHGDQVRPLWLLRGWRS